MPSLSKQNNSEVIAPWGLWMELPLQFSSILELTRALAAAFVVIYHLRALLFVEYSNVTQSSWLSNLVYFSSSFGSASVMAFFVISGYFISLSVIKSYANKKWDWKKYLIHRVVRLWIVLIPALLLVFFWDTLGTTLFGPAVYDGLASDRAIMPSFRIINRLSIESFFGNLFFLQGSATHTFGTNGALWSLAYEFWYYILFPLLFLIVNRSSWKSKSIYVILFTVIILLVSHTISKFFIIWLLGTLLIFIPRFSFLQRIPMVLKSLCLVPLFYLAFIHERKLLHINPFVYSFIISLMFSTWMYLGLNCRSTAPDSTSNNGADTKKNKSISLPKMFADFSFSLYITHMPLLIFIHAFIVHQQGPIKWQPSIDRLLFGFAITVFLFMFAWLFSLVTESKTDKVRQFLELRLQKL